MVTRRRPRTLTQALAILDVIIERVAALEQGQAANRKELEVQFKRMAQLQAELDELRASSSKARG
jgi:cell division protein FtsB